MYVTGECRIGDVLRNSYAGSVVDAIVMKHQGGCYLPSFLTVSECGLKQYDCVRLECCRAFPRPHLQSRDSVSSNLAVSTTIAYIRLNVKIDSELRFEPLASAACPTFATIVDSEGCHVIQVPVVTNCLMQDVIAILAPCISGTPDYMLTLIDSADEYVNPSKTVKQCRLTDESYLVLAKSNGLWHQHSKRQITPVDASLESQEQLDIMRMHTEKIARKNPPSSPESLGTVLYALKSMLEKSNRELLLFESDCADSVAPAGIVDESSILSGLSSPDADEITITAEHLRDLLPNYAHVDMSLPEILESPQWAADLAAQIRALLARAFQLDQEKFNAMTFSVGSFKAHVQASDWSAADREHLVTGAAFLDMECNGTSVEIHPLFVKCNLDASVFDPRGNKSNFDGRQWTLGPDAAQQKTYYQPRGDQGWIRYGLNVLGKFPDDKWLHPFQHKGNWWRAYHGTGVKGMTGIARDAANPSGVMNESPAKCKLGEGVYVSPHLEYASGFYCGRGEVNGTEYVIVFQCAVKPGSILKSGFSGHDRATKSGQQ
jgi:hypothetical protein